MKIPTHASQKSKFLASASRLLRKNMNNMKTTSTTLLALALFAGAANAATIVVPTDVDESSFFQASYDSSRTINGSGLSSSLATGDAEPTTWPTHDTDVTSPSSNHTVWLSASHGTSANASSTWLMFDLGQSYELGGMHVWNWNDDRSQQRGINVVDVKFATALTGTFGSTNASDTGWGGTQQKNFGTATFLNSYTGEDHSFTPVTARYVLFDIQSNDGDIYTGFSEVVFTAIPEPSAVLLSSLGGLLLLRRRRG